MDYHAGVTTIRKEACNALRYLLNDPDPEGRDVSAPYQDLTTAIRHYREALS